MPLEGSYAVWNNRGGTGKTTLTYHLANKYAAKHPDKTILLIDMCPQADLSHALLGDDEHQLDYVSQLGSLKKDPMLIGDQIIAKTVSGYLDLATSINFSSLNVDPRTFLINVSKFNPQLSRNLYLLCGDASLELVAKSLEQKRDQHFSLSQFGLNAWKAVTSCLKQFIKRIAERKGIKLVVFIDMNSSFSILTEIGLVAADKLLIPITEDHLHRNGFEYMFALLYGFSQPSNVYYYYRHFSFYFRANEHDIKLPKIHLIINKMTNTTNEAKSNSLNDSQWLFIFELFKKHPQTFNIRNNCSLPENLSEFKQQYVINIGEQISTNKIIRLAVRLHSPLLNNKHSHTNNNKHAMSNGTNPMMTLPPNTSKSSCQLNRPTSPTTNHLNLAASPISRSLSSSSRPFNLRTKINISRSTKNVHSLSEYQHEQEAGKASNLLNATNDNRIYVDESNPEHTEAILYDKILEQIVDSLNNQS